MHIYYPCGEDVLIGDGIERLNETHDLLVTFLASDQPRLWLDADQSRNPIGFARVLRGLEFVKTTDPLKVSIREDEAVEISGNPRWLGLFIKAFRFDPEKGGSHHHADYIILFEDPTGVADGSLGVIIEDLEFEDLE